MGKELRLAEKGINLYCVYATTSQQSELTTVVFSSDNDSRAVEVAEYILSLTKGGRQQWRRP